MNKDQNKSKDTGLAFVLILLIISRFTSDNNWLSAAIVLLILAMAAPVVFKPLAVLWFGLSNVLGRMMSAVILTLLFYSILMPIAFVRRILGADRLNLNGWKKEKSTAFILREHLFRPDDLEKPF